MAVKRLVDTLGDNLSEVKAERHWDILGDVKADALTDPVAFTLMECEAKKLDETNSYTI